jgi:hypothetical protein
VRDAAESARAARRQRKRCDVILGRTHTPLSSTQHNDDAMASFDDVLAGCLSNENNVSVFWRAKRIGGSLS